MWPVAGWIGRECESAVSKASATRESVGLGGSSFIMPAFTRTDLRASASARTRCTSQTRAFARASASASRDASTRRSSSAERYLLSKLSALDGDATTVGSGVREAGRLMFLGFWGSFAEYDTNPAYLPRRSGSFLVSIIHAYLCQSLLTKITYFRGRLCANEFYDGHVNTSLTPTSPWRSVCMLGSC
ncbi:hypothetical protein BC830DRAFT_372992 [Chytriomyces sp. MP71]|nr:hypothetical protein BC830DRAFT_372992 [Chytriomyces sp. MP71]